MTPQTRLLVIDAYDAAGRESLRQAGATPAGQLYAGVLQNLAPDTEVQVIEAEESGVRLPTGDRLAAWQGIVWTGSNLTIHQPTPAVDRQIATACDGFTHGVPQFGSCWAIQLAAVAAGGRCAANPKGREFGIARSIRPTPEGACHPLLSGRGARYEGLCSHEDMVVELPPGARVLARNDFSDIQALEVRFRSGTFWAVQYHPEYDFHEVARLAVLRQQQLIDQKRFADVEDLQRFVADFLTLHQEPHRRDLLQRHQVSESIHVASVRQLEMQNWLDAQVDASRNQDENRSVS